ncbi:MAG: 3-isopropylmalate dehydratase large subunit [Nitrospinae bacterium]|nr:3-isopropylmalate dehydratase large subunit [Nitrospinota bacterium]
MGQTITEKILAHAAGKEAVSAGDNIWVNVDTLMTHDVCGPGTIGIFKREFGDDAKVWDKEKVVIIPDHYIFTKDKHANRNLEVLREFAQEQNIKYFYDAFSKSYKGVCHVALAEGGHNRPGEIMFGTDSHTCTAGAFGQFATGIGNTDAAFIMGTGKLWVKVPESMRFEVEGDIPDYVLGKDIILQIIGDIGVDGATYRAMEFTGSGIYNLSIEERMTICNMAIEAGGKNGIIAPDSKTEEFVKSRSSKPYTLFLSDNDARYVKTITYKGKDLEPVVAKPHSPDNMEKVSTIKGENIDRVYIGSCTGGKIEDFKNAARILNNNEVKVDTFIVPSTVMVEAFLKEETLNGKSYMDIFSDAGCKIAPPSCAACLGGPADTFGRTKTNEKVVSTTNRNFPGRMGSKASSVYLASPYTAAASALTGKITDPRDYL